MHILKIAALLIGSIAAPFAQAAFVCSQDLNGDGLTDAPGENATCTATAQGSLCPIRAADCTVIVSPPVETCPIDPALPCTTGTCSKPTACSRLILGLYACHHNSYIGSAAGCAAQCVTTAACTMVAAPPNPATCPIDNNLACMDNGGKMQCSPNACTDTTITPPVTTNVDTSTMLRNDGARNPDGSCGGQIIIFTGKASQCRPSGWQTLSRDCCQSDGESLSDSTGSITDATLVVDVITLVYDAASVAYAMYALDTSVGMTTGAAAGAAADAAGSFIMAVDPTTLVIAVVVAVIMDMYANACDKDEILAALLNKSGYCHQTGTYCKEKWGGSCVQRARVFCCFNSMMARIIQEQGRPQLKSFATGWASADPKRPDCRGFTPEEFQNLDFSRIDFTEYYATLMKDLDPAKQAALINDVSTKSQTFLNNTAGAP